MADVNEFIDTYSDDLITIHEARAAAYTHPLRLDYAFAESLLDASFCRILVVFVIGGIKAMLESWLKRDKLGVLKTYFAKGVTNGDRIISLYKAFTNAGIPVDKDVFNDYLAIKYLRNTIIHSGWKPKEKSWLEARGFPKDTRQLTKEHLDKIENVNQNMLLYIALTGIADVSAPKPAKLIRLDETLTRRRDESGIIHVRDMARIIWCNLERISNFIYRDIESVAFNIEYDWTAGRSKQELEALDDEERKRLFYLAARRAGEEGYEPLAKHLDLAREALEFWRDYRQRVFIQKKVSISDALDVFTSPFFKPEMPEWSIIANAEDEIAKQLVDKIYLENQSLSRRQIVDALKAGKYAYKHCPNIMPVILLTLRLPIVDPRNTSEYIEEAKRAIDLFSLNRAWFDCVEHHRRLSDSNLGFYNRMCKEFTQRQCGN